MRIWAISDLHLSLGGDKPMDPFGDHWKNHHQRVAQAWDCAVTADDLVLLPGDFSWANKPNEAGDDLAWLGARPGWKVLFKGNHDHWWPKSKARMVEILPPRTLALKKTAAIIGGVGIFGVRGGDFEPGRHEDTRTREEITAELAREEHELRLSIEHLAALEAAAGTSCALRVCACHYPPYAPGGSASCLTALIRAAGAAVCVYGHLHRPEGEYTRREGLIDGVPYRCVSCDFADFAPVELLAAPIVAAAES